MGINGSDGQQGTRDLTGKRQECETNLCRDGVFGHVLRRTAGFCAVHTFRITGVTGMGNANARNADQGKSFARKVRKMVQKGEKSRQNMKKMYFFIKIFAQVIDIQGGGYIIYDVK